MKLTDEIFENCRWLDDYTVRYNYKGQNRKYKITKCEYCGTLCLILDLNNGCFCSRGCSTKDRNNSLEWRLAHSEKLTGRKDSEETKKNKSKSHIGQTRLGRKGEKSNFWKGGAEVTKIPLFEIYRIRLEKYEEIRDNNSVLEVRCTYCGKWYRPTKKSISNRLSGIKANDTGRFYCSNGCKKVCPLYWKDAESLIKRDKIAAGRILPHELNREVQPELRQLVFQRDKYECQKCGSTISLHCHHFEGIEQNPIESADMDMCITLCKSCHKEAHKKVGCRYIDLRRCTEEIQTMVVN